MRRPPARRPPLRRCQDCGGDFYGYSGVLCARCVKALNAEPAGESLRDFRRRLKGSGR